MTLIRYAPSGGLNVRKTAAGTKITTLNAGDLMYEISGVNKVTASLNGTSYVWVKVHYYNSINKPASEGDGWVPISLANGVSTANPSMSDTYKSNAYLSQHHRLINAHYIYHYLKNKGWSSNAIYALLGNMETESSINPGMWNALVTGDPNRAYGLTQWKPSTKLTTWLSQQNKSDNIQNQLERILYEVANDNEQWQKNKFSPVMTFSQFTTSSKTCSVLAEYFLRCYEAPSPITNAMIQERQANANKWATLLGYL